MLIDFEKAFDTISWKFIFETLDFFKFGPSIKKWIKTFYNGTKSCVLQNGFTSDYIYLQRGCRQGDPISPYFFLVCAEILGILIRNNRDIRGIFINIHIKSIYIGIFINLEIFQIFINFIIFINIPI